MKNKRCCRSKSSKAASTPLSLKIQKIQTLWVKTSQLSSILKVLRDHHDGGWSCWRSKSFLSLSSVFCMPAIISTLHIGNFGWRWRIRIFLENRNLLQNLSSPWNPSSSHQNILVWFSVWPPLLVNSMKLTPSHCSDSKDDSTWWERSTLITVVQAEPRVWSHLRDLLLLFLLTKFEFLNF